MVTMFAIYRPTDGIQIPNARKIHLVVEQQAKEEAFKVFEGTGIKVIIDGDEMLGSAIGSSHFTEQFAAKNIELFVNEIESLPKIC